MGPTNRRWLTRVALALAGALAVVESGTAQTGAAPSASPQPTSVVQPIKRVAPKTPPLPEAVAKTVKNSKQPMAKPVKGAKTGSKNGKTAKAAKIEASGKGSPRCATGRVYDAAQRTCVRTQTPAAGSAKATPTAAQPKTK